MKRLYIRKIMVLPTTRTLVLKSYWIWRTINREKSIVESLHVKKFCWFDLDVKCMCKMNVQIYYWKDGFIYLLNIRRIIITFRIGNLQKETFFTFGMNKSNACFIWWAFIKKPDCDVPFLTCTKKQHSEKSFKESLQVLIFT